MSDPLFSNAEHDAITDAAAHWCMRLHAEDCTATERKAFEQWLKAHPLHAIEYNAMLEVWDIAGQIEPLNPAPVRQAQADRPDHVRPRRGGRWAKLAAAAAVVAMALPIAGYVGWHQGWLPDAYETYNADTATRLVMLEDGS
ncbi:FecR protein, partial [Pseudomonas syringae pv. japonica str. M301072]